MSRSVQQLKVIDSHTAGEPTRVVVGGAPAVGGTMVEVRDLLRSDHDWIRRSCLLEPRGHEAMVGALLCESKIDSCAAGVVFFNNTGYIKGCVHGTIGLAVTLAHMGKIGAGVHKIETPVGVVSVELGEVGEVTVQNVRSWRHAAGAEVEVPGYGTVVGDIAWGGNWFFLTDAPEGMPIELGEVQALTDFGRAVRQGLEKAGITGAEGGEIDHIEIFGPPTDPARSDSRNFVLCPGMAYDRSPCGTGTSAKLACLAADNRLAPGQPWRQAGILDTVFTGTVAPAPDGAPGVIPTVTGHAFINGEATLLIDPNDPFRHGITA